MMNDVADIRTVRVLVFIFLVIGTASEALTQSRVPYQILATKNAAVSMRDGISLETDIYRPCVNGIAVPGKFPTVLVRTPYDRSGDEDYASAFVPHGYAVVVQSVRGRYGSGGRWSLFRDDSDDGYDTAAWIASQEWSDGGIGTLGGSYEGGTQYAMAVANPPALKAMVPLVAATNPGLYGIRHHGAFELRFFTWLFSVGNPVDSPSYNSYYPGDSSTKEALAIATQDYRQYVVSLPFRAGTTPLRMAPDYESALVDTMSHGDYDDFWKNIGVDVVSHLAEVKDVPMHHISGWYDSWAMDVANLDYVSLAKTKKSPQRLTMGPWTHSGAGDSSTAGEVEFGAEAIVSVENLELAWMDRWLKGVQNGVEKESPVRIFVMGGGDGHKTPEGRIFVGGHWRNENEWPLKRAIITSYYLHENGSLTQHKPGKEAPDRFQFDPKNPVPSIGGNVSSQKGLMAAGAFDQRCRPDVLGCSDRRRLSARNDVLTFQTLPLEQNVEVTGRLVVNLWASSSALDTDFTVKLVDVYPPNTDFPDGVELNIADSIVRARYRDSLEKPQLMVPDRICRFQIELNPTSLIFAKGHRMRVDISSSNFPRFDINPNSGEPLNQNRRTVIAINTIYHDSEHPSEIQLPIIPVTTP
jgi:putative CocE/NonD family hydrolase